MDRSTYRKPFGSRHLSRRQFSWLSAGAAATALSVPLVGTPSRAFAALAQASNLSGTVSQWCYPLASTGQQSDDEALWKGLADEFTGANPGVQVSVEVLPWKDRNDKLTTALAAGAGPDVGYLNADFVPQHAGDGNLLPLDDLVGGDTDLLENAKTNLTFDGKLYAAPILGTVTTAVFNTKVFEAAGVTEYPTTWDEMLAIGPKIRDAGYLLTSYAGALEQTLNLTYFPLLWQAGGEVVNADGTAAAFNSPEGVDALNFVVGLFKEKFTDLDEGVTVPPPDGGKVMEGKVAILMTGEAGGVKRYEAGSWGKGSAKIAAPLKRKISTSYGTTAGFGVFKDAK
ncbi:MAG: extracellular solute-binding protein, partial [Thermomicrobiales bacterium]